MAGYTARAMTLARLSLPSLGLCLLPSLASAQEPVATSPAPAVEEMRVAPTGPERTAALVTPTVLVTPAAAMPALRGRVLLGADAQSPSGALDGIRPQFAAELGLGKGFTLGAGTRWVGGDAVSGTDGLSPYGQLRFQVFGDPLGRNAVVGGVSLTYKQIGFQGGERELEAAFTTTFRSSRLEAGGQVVLGQSLREGEEHDGELRAYAALRVLPTLSVGLTRSARRKVARRDASGTPSAACSPRST